MHEIKYLVILDNYTNILKLNIFIIPYYCNFMLNMELNLI